MTGFAVAVVAVALAAVNEWRHQRTMARLLQEERERSGDLLTRLQARSLTEYAYLPPVPQAQETQRPAAPPEDDREYLTDATGLVVVELEREIEAAR